MLVQQGHHSSLRILKFINNCKSSENVMKVSLFGFILRIAKERNYAEAYITNNNN